MTQVQQQATPRGACQGVCCAGRGGAGEEQAPQQRGTYCP